MLANAKLNGEVAGIGGLSREELVDAWIKAYGVSPPKGVKRPLLELAAAWNLQARRIGGLPAKTRKLLLGTASDRPLKPAKAKSEQVADASSTTSGSKSSEAVRLPLAVGTRLVREWNGRPYVVTVTTSGFELDGKAYRSLSAIARRITGARWSGPRFFGL